MSAIAKLGDFSPSVEVFLAQALFVFPAAESLPMSFTAATNNNLMLWKSKQIVHFLSEYSSLEKIFRYLIHASTGFLVLTLVSCMCYMILFWKCSVEDAWYKLETILAFLRESLQKNIEEKTLKQDYISYIALGYRLFPICLNCIYKSFLLWDKTWGCYGKRRDRDHWFCSLDIYKIWYKK